MTTSKVNWTAVEVDYRAGLLTVKAIGEKHGITPTRINQVAKKNGWERDLQAQVKLRAAEKSRKAIIKASIIDPDTQELIVETKAQVLANIEENEREDILAARQTVANLQREIATLGNVDMELLLRELPRYLTDYGENVSSVEALYFAILSLPSRVKMMQDLSNAMKNLVTLERLVYNFENREDDKIDPLTALLNRINGNALQVTSE